MSLPLLLVYRLVFYPAIVLALVCRAFVRLYLHELDVARGGKTVAAIFPGWALLGSRYRLSWLCCWRGVSGVVGTLWYGLWLVASMLHRLAGLAWRLGLLALCLSGLASPGSPLAPPPS